MSPHPSHARRRLRHYRSSADQSLRSGAHPGNGPRRARARGRRRGAGRGVRQPPAELGPFVERLAFLIATFPAEAIALAKAAVDAAEQPTRDGLLEAHYFNQALASAAAERRMSWFLASGGQTPEVELDLAAMIDTYEE